MITNGLHIRINRVFVRYRPGFESAVSGVNSISHQITWTRAQRAYGRHDESIDYKTECDIASDSAVKLDAEKFLARISAQTNREAPISPYSNRSLVPFDRRSQQHDARVL